MLCKKKKNIGVFLTTSFIAGMVTVQSTNVNAASQSIAQNKGYSASSNQGINKFGLAFDGNMGSRWESQQGVDPQWIEADLGAEYVITGAELKWETAAGKDYEIQVSSDGTHWDSVYTKVGGNGGDEVITFSVTKTGRYVRMFGTSRTTTYGYSLYEFEIYGTPVTNTLEKPLITPDGGIYTSDQLVNIAAGYPNAVIRYTLDGSEPTISNGIKYMGPFTIFDTTTVKALAYYGSVASPVTSTIIEVNNASNIALNKNSEAKSENGAQKSNLAFDGKTNTRWESEQGVDDEWILVDLGKKYSVSGVKLIWEAAYGKKYKIQVSEDKNTWQDAYDQASGSGGTENLTFPTPMEGRYVKMYGIQRATQWGYSLYEFEVYGTAVVNREDLQTSINNTKILRGSKVVGSANGNVPQSAVDDLQAAIDVAQNVYSNPAATQIQIDTQAIILSGACADFNNSVIVINKAGLMTAINDAKALKNSKTVGTGDGNVPQSAVDNLQVAIGAAENVYNDALATQIQIDAQITALSGASGNFNNSVIVSNKIGLMTAINDAKALKNSKTVGTGDGNVPQSAVDDLQAAIDAAENVYNDASATQSQIDAQITALSGASGNFNNSVIVINKTGLMTVINDAKALKNSKTVGTGNGNVPQSAVDDLQVAIDAAENVYNDASATQSQIDAQITASSGACSDFNNSVIGIIVHKNELNIAINDAKALKNSKTVGTGNGNVPQSAVDDLQVAIDAAENVYNNASATQSQIDAQITALSGARSDFNNSVIGIIVHKSELNIAINDARVLKNSKTVGNGNVPQNAVDDLQTIIDAAENVYNDSAATQSDVEEQRVKLAEASNDFNNSIIGISVDKIGLMTAINNAKTLRHSKTMGNAEGNIPKSAVDNLQTVIDAAENVYNNIGATQSDIEAQVKNLSAACNNFNNAVIKKRDSGSGSSSKSSIKAERRHLKTLLEQAVDLLTSKKSIVLNKEFKVEVDKLEEAINNARTVYNSTSSVIKDIKRQRNRLQEAIDDFNMAILKENDVQVPTEIDNIKQGTVIDNFKDLINKVISIIKSSGVKNVDSLMEIKTRNEIGAFTGTTATTTDLPKISDIKEQKEQKEQIEEDRVVKKDISESENSEETDGLNNQKTTQIEKTEDDKNIFIKKAGIVAAISIVSISSGFSIYKFRIKK